MHDGLDMVSVLHDWKRDECSVKFSCNKPIYDVIRIAILRFNAALGKQIAVCIADCIDNLMFDERREAESKRPHCSLMNSLDGVHYVDTCLEEFPGEP